MTSPNPSEIFTPFLPTTFTIPEHDDRLDTFLNETFANFADVINDKSIGAYTQSTENFNGQKWIYITPKIVRNGYQAITYIPVLASGTYAMPVPKVNPQFVITQAWGSASKPCTAVGAGDGDYFSFYSQGNVNVNFTMSDTSIVLTVGGLVGTYSGFIVVEYLRNGF